MKKLFGTDGIRAVAGEFPLDYSSTYILGKACAELLLTEGLKPKILIGRDTRESGAWIEEALFHGIGEGGGEAVSGGIIPTSAVSFLTKKHGFSTGIVVSASHNPYEDNGIKIFSREGLKIPAEWEVRLEKAILESKEKVERKKIRVDPVSSLGEDYKNFLEGQISGIPSHRHLKIVLDCSNGASFEIAPRVFTEFGFEVDVISNSPNGKNINNNCGSLHPRLLADKVIESKGDIGIAYDGDADRAIWVDEKGRILNGDHTLFVQSRFMMEKGRLKSDAVIATTMSNMGLEKALEGMGLRLFRTPVGDKFVLEQMMKLGTNLGGEQSGHTIFLDDCPTGDGILTSLKMLEVMLVTGAPLSELVEDLVEFPQILSNVRVKRKVDFKEFPEIIGVVKRIKQKLGSSGRIDLRYSGTEPVARVMIEGEDKKQIEKLSRQLTDIIARNLGS